MRPHWATEIYAIAAPVARQRRRPIKWLTLQIKRLIIVRRRGQNVTHGSHLDRVAGVVMMAVGSSVGFILIGVSGDGKLICHSDEIGRGRIRTNTDERQLSMSVRVRPRPITATVVRRTSCCLL